MRLADILAYVLASGAQRDYTGDYALAFFGIVMGIVMLLIMDNRNSGPPAAGGGASA